MKIICPKLLPLRTRKVWSLSSTGKGVLEPQVKSIGYECDQGQDIDYGIEQEVEVDSVKESSKYAGAGSTACLIELEDSDRVFDDAVSLNEKTRGEREACQPYFPGRFMYLVKLALKEDHSESKEVCGVEDEVVPLKV